MPRHLTDRPGHYAGNGGQLEPQEIRYLPIPKSFAAEFQAHPFLNGQQFDGGFQAAASFAGEKIILGRRNNPRVVIGYLGDMLLLQ